MVGHEAVGVAEPAEALDGRPEDVEEELPVGVGEDDGLLPSPREVTWYRAPGYSMRSGRAMATDATRRCGQGRTGSGGE